MQMSERWVPAACDTANWGPCWYLNDLVSTIFWGGGAIEEARLVGAALGIAEPPRQVWAFLVALWLKKKQKKKLSALQEMWV